MACVGKIAGSGLLDMFVNGIEMCPECEMPNIWKCNKHVFKLEKKTCCDTCMSNRFKNWSNLLSYLA